MAEKSKILVIGSTGYIGRYLVEASARAGHPTYALIRESTAAHPDKSKLLDSFKSLGVSILYGDVNDHGSLVAAVKQVDVVISAIGVQQIPDQTKIIAAIKEVGTIKRFLPSEFGVDVDRIESVEPATTVFGLKAMIRRATEAEGIPYTYVACNAFAGYFLPNLGQFESQVPPRDKVTIIGDGTSKAIFVKEEDIATYTIKAVDDPRTLNKVLYMRPPANTLSYDDIVILWEKKIGKTLEKTYILEDELLQKIQASPFPINAVLAISHSTFVKGAATCFDIDPSFGVEASELYPEVKYTTVDEYLSLFV